MKNYIGIDLGKQSSYFVIKNHEGRRLFQASVFNDRASVTKTLQPYIQTSVCAVIEACCNYYWMYQELTRLGIVVILAHPLKTRAIADAKAKNDRLDANMLCDLLRADLIPRKQRRIAYNSYPRL